MANDDPAFSSEAEERIFREMRDSADAVDWSRAQRARFPNLVRNDMQAGLTTRKPRHGEP